MTRPIDFSRTEGRPMRNSFCAITASASRTESMSIGKNRTITCHPTTSRMATIGQAASVHSAKL